LHWPDIDSLSAHALWLLGAHEAQAFRVQKRHALFIFTQGLVSPAMAAQPA